MFEHIQSSFAGDQDGNFTVLAGSLPPPCFPSVAACLPVATLRE
ncbi:hypothetical protein [Caballeronia sp. DA-9]